MPTAVKFEPVSEADLDFIAAHCREACKVEVEAASALPVRKALAQVADASERKMAARVPEGTVAVFGIAPGRKPREGHPWMLCSGLVHSRTTALYRQGKPRLEELAEGYDYLSNWVLASNRLSQRFQRWLGFAIGPEYRYIAGKRFLKFSKE